MQITATARALPRLLWVLGSLAGVGAGCSGSSDDGGDSAGVGGATGGAPAGPPPPSAGAGTSAGGSGGSAGSGAGTSTDGGVRPNGGGPGGGAAQGGTSPAAGGAQAGGPPSMGGAPSSGGVASGGTGASAGAAGRGGAPSSGGGLFTCPAPPFAGSPVSNGATAQAIAGVPPQDSFITDPMDLIIMEGPVWFNGALYVSQIENGPLFPGFPGGPNGSGGTGGGQGMDSAPPPARILKVTENGQVSVVVPDSGTNGLAIDPNGGLVGGNHKTGSVSKVDLNGGAPVDLVATYMGTRFNSPNDLTFGADGTLYFTDPDYQAPVPSPQSETRAYRLPPGSSTAIPIGEGLRQPNGVTMSPDRKILYLSSSSGISSFPVAADGSLGTATRFGQGSLNGSDGMGMDCAGNVYTTSGQNVIITSPAGSEVGRIAVPGGVQSATNVAFGGADHKTIYITAQGTNGRAGLFKLAGAIPGMPY